MMSFIRKWPNLALWHVICTYLNVLARRRLFEFSRCEQFLFSINPLQFCLLQIVCKVEHMQYNDSTWSNWPLSPVLYWPQVRKIIDHKQWVHMDATLHLCTSGNCPISVWKEFTNFNEFIRVFTIRKSDAFLSDYLTDLKLHRTK